MLFKKNQIIEYFLVIPFLVISDRKLVCLSPQCAPCFLLLLSRLQGDLIHMHAGQADPAFSFAFVTSQCVGPVYARCPTNVKCNFLKFSWPQFSYLTTKRVFTCGGCYWLTNPAVISTSPFCLLLRIEQSLKNEIEL